jgi:hypothetical protein
MVIKDAVPPSELAQLGSDALDSYERITGKAVRDLPRPKNMKAIISFAEKEKKVFRETRHPPGRFNAIRSYLGKHI